MAPNHKQACLDDIFRETSRKTCNRFQHSDCNSQKITQKKRNFEKQTGSSLDFSSVLGYRSRGQEAWLGCWPAGQVDAWQARFSALMGSFPLHQNQTPDPGTALHIKRHIKHPTLESNQHILGSTTATFSVLADIPPSAPQGEAAPLAPACSDSVCGCRDIGRSQWCCSSAGAEPIPDWAPAQRERPHLIQHDQS